MQARRAITVAALGAAGLLTAAVPNKINTTVMSGVDAPLKSISTLAFGPNGVLYAADPQAATIYAIDLGGAATKGTAVRGPSTLIGK